MDPRGKDNEPWNNGAPANTFVERSGRAAAHCRRGKRTSSAMRLPLLQCPIGFCIHFLVDRIGSFPLPSNALNLFCRLSSGDLDSRQREEPLCTSGRSGSSRWMTARRQARIHTNPSSRNVAPETCFSRQTVLFREVDNVSFFQVILQGGI